MTWREFRLDITDDLIRRFEANVDRTTTPDGCHLWTGTLINSFGHGGFNLGPKQGSGHHYAPAHRVAWVIEHRRVIPPRWVVRHRPRICHQPPCVRADHLVLGTVKQNMTDRRADGTAVCGEAHYQAKLTAQEVLDIRDRYVSGDGTATMISEDYGVTPSLVLQILRGEIWQHITGGVNVVPPRAFARPRLRPRPASDFFRGVDHPRSIHTPEKVLQLVSSVRSGQTVAGAARDLGFTESSARQIIKGRSWSHVTGIKKASKV